MPSYLVPKKFKAGKLHSGSKHGPIVHDHDQMVAIMMSERRNEAEHGGEYQEGHKRSRPTRKKR